MGCQDRKYKMKVRTEDEKDEEIERMNRKARGRTG
jgi:hypothetical protein